MMTVGKNWSVLTTFFGSLVLLLSCPVVLFGSDSRVDQNHILSAHLKGLERKFSSLSTLQADFIQEKRLAAFQNTLILKGRIYIMKPDKIAWHIDEPIKYSVVITEKKIRQWDEDSDQIIEVKVSKHPYLPIMLDRITAWFKGHFVSLTDDYAVHIINKNPLVLTFTPHEKSPVNDIIENVTLTFSDNEMYLQRMEIGEISGDSTTIHFKNTRINIPLDSCFFKVRPCVP